MIIVPPPKSGKSLHEPVLLYLLSIRQSILQGHLLGLLLANQWLLPSAARAAFFNLKGRLSLSLFQLQGPFSLQLPCSKIQNVPGSCLSAVGCMLYSTSLSDLFLCAFLAQEIVQFSYAMNYVDLQDLSSTSTINSTLSIIHSIPAQNKMQQFILILIVYYFYMVSVTLSPFIVLWVKRSK